METATREYTAPFLSTMKSWLVEGRVFSSTTTRASTTAAATMPRNAPVLFFLVWIM